MLLKISIPTLIIIRNDSYTPNQHIRMISDGSCDCCCGP